jgi:hypothetical protein
MTNIINRAIGKAGHKIKEKYNEKQAEKKAFEQNEKYRGAIDRNAHSQEYWKSYREAASKREKASGERDALTPQQPKENYAGKARKGISQGLTGLSLGSANALKNDMYGVGQVDFKGMDFLTMGGSPGAGTLTNIEELTGVTKRKAKTLNPNMGQGQQGRGNIVINVGGSGSNKKRRPTTQAQVPKEKDWQDNLEDLIGF